MDAVIIDAPWPPPYETMGAGVRTLSIRLSQLGLGENVGGPGTISPDRPEKLHAPPYRGEAVGLCHHEDVSLGSVRGIVALHSVFPFV